MLKNYLKIALRNLQRNSVYSFINILGLSIGIAISLMILLWVYDETSYNKFLPKYNQLHQAWVHGYFDGSVVSFTSVPQPLAEGLKEKDSHIIKTALADWGGEHLLTVGDTRLIQQGYFVSEQFLEMFQYPLIKGSAENVLDDPSSIVLSESAARALFGEQDPINQVVKVNNQAELKVTGILKDIPDNSSLKFNCLMPWSAYAQYADWIRQTKDNWEEFSFQVFAEVQSGTDIDVVNKNIQHILAEKSASDVRRDVMLYPMSRWRLYSLFKNGVEAGGMIEYVQAFTGIALFVLMIACINFMNLATARSERRAREVGIRKSIGSGRKELMGQFLGESILVSCLAFIVALVLVEVFLPFYNQLVEKHLFIDYTSTPFWIFGVSMILFTGVVSGSYPAFYLSKFQPAQVLKGKLSIGKTGSTPRKVLVVIQFCISIVLITGTLVIHQQINHVKARDLGYEQGNLLVVEGTADLQKDYSAVKEQLLNLRVATSVTRSQSPVTDIYSNNFLDWPGKPTDNKVLFNTLRVDYDYVKTIGARMLLGREFSQDFKSDSAAIIVNKTALDIMQLEDPIGTKLKVWDRSFELIGVVDNLLIGSLFSDVQPMFMVLHADASNFITIRLAPTDDLQEAINQVQTVVEKHNPAYPFDYTFADTEFAQKFASINLISRLSNVFASLAIFITCLGLFGLAAFMAEQRTKEIGIRKVMGASVGRIVMMMSADFSRLVLVAFLIAAPLSWWAMDSYLHRYAYRIDVPVWIIVLSGMVAITLTVFIVSSQAVRAARVNPAQSLRNE